MIERFRLMLENLKLSPSEFADRIGVQRSSISHILSGRNKPSVDFLEKFLAAFPETDVNYLITGKKHSIEPLKNAIAVPEQESSVKELSAALIKEVEKKPAPENQEPVEKIILIYKNNTFSILYPSGK